SDPLVSAKLLLTEFNQEIIVNLSTPTTALGFLTALFYKLPRNNFSAIMIDATFGTNKMGWELYALMGVIDGTGFPLSYLLIAAGKSRNITDILSQWMCALKNRQLTSFSYILTDKDFCEINAAQKVWPDARLQLCFWHVVHAIKQRIASRKPILDKYNPIIAHQECSAIDPYWKKLDNNNTMHCPLELRKQVIDLVEIHFSRHILLPKSDENNLINLWIYFWNQWYCQKRWALWARAADSEICHIKTTMIVESHWRHIKQTYKVPNILPIKESITEYEDEYIVEGDDYKYEEYEQNISHLNGILIKPLEKMVTDIEKLENQHTTPKTSKDFNRNTT
ncbi:11181_t:CDS:2, partial [Gigaspora margarita]